MVGELTVAQRINMLALLWTVVNGDITAMASQLRSLSEPFRPVDDAKFVQDVREAHGPVRQGLGRRFRATCSTPGWPSCATTGCAWTPT